MSIVSFASLVGRCGEVIGEGGVFVRLVRLIVYFIYLVLVCSCVCLPSYWMLSFVPRSSSFSSFPMSALARWWLVAVRDLYPAEAVALRGWPLSAEGREKWGRQRDGARGCTGDRTDIDGLTRTHTSPHKENTPYKPTIHNNKRQ